MIYVFIQNEDCNREIEYVFDTFFFILGIEFVYINKLESGFKAMENDILISYAYDESGYDDLSNCFDNKIAMQDSRELFNELFMKSPCFPRKVKRYKLDKPIKNNYNIISLYNSCEDLYIKKSFDNRKIILTNIDVISDSFFMLSRYEEVMQPEVYKGERYNRFPVTASIAYKYKFLLRPIVNEYIELLWEWIDDMNLGYKRKSWWGEKEFAACLTHDVDNIQRYSKFTPEIRTTLSLLLKHKSPSKAIKNIKSFIRSKKNYKKDAFWTFEYITSMEKGYGFNSSFYFISGGISEFEGNYKINDERILKLIKELEDGEFEVGYHGSFNSYDDFELMKQEKEKIDEIVSVKDYGCRQHFLRFKMPYTLENQARLGLLYDTTMGYAEHEGFRCGICFPYRPYDLIQRKVLNIWEIPPVVMEFTLQGETYRGLSQEEGLKQIERLIDTIKEYGGVFTLLWHNSTLDSIRGWNEAYEKAMFYLYRNNCLGIDGRRLINIISL